MMKPLIFLVHIPKTAGSTVNSYLREHLPNGISHCEAFIGDDGVFGAEANRRDWLSGHIDLQTAQERLAKVTKRPVRYFACMRNPAAHVKSHYNWLIEIYYRGGEFFDSHPQVIRDISQNIRESKNDTASIIANLSRYPGLFQNCQSRILLGKNFNWNRGQLHQQIAQYEMIVDNSEIDRLLTQILGSDVSVDRTENKSSYHFEEKEFSKDEMRNFLARWNTLDEILYSRLFGCGIAKGLVQDAFKPEHLISNSKKLEKGWRLRAKSKFILQSVKNMFASYST